AGPISLDPRKLGPPDRFCQGLQIRVKSPLPSVGILFQPVNNGTLVNGTGVKRCRLAFGDIIRVGPLTLSGWQNEAQLDGKSRPTREVQGLCPGGFVTGRTTL